MIVVHPYDPGTAMLGLIYEGIDGVRVFNSWRQRRDILKALVAAPAEEPVLLLGHGGPTGLYDLRYGLVIRDSDAELLLDRPNLIGIWCYASDYARTHRLKGFFSGMFISEAPEALELGVRATAEEIDRQARDFARRFGELLREGVRGGVTLDDVGRGGLPLEAIARELMDPRYQVSDLTRYNYSRLTWRPRGDEPLPTGWEP